MSVLLAVSAGGVARSSKRQGGRHPQPQRCKCTGHRHGPPVASWWSASACWTTSFWAWSSNKLGFFAEGRGRKKVVALSGSTVCVLTRCSSVIFRSVCSAARGDLKMLYRDNEILIFDEPTRCADPASDRRADGDHARVQEGGQVHLFVPTSSTRSWRSPTSLHRPRRAVYDLPWTSRTPPRKSFPA